MRRPLSHTHLYLSVTDIVLLAFAAGLLQGHLRLALGGHLLALLFALQHAVLIGLLLWHRAPEPAGVSRIDLALAWAGTHLPALMRMSREPSLLGTSLAAFGSIFATLALLSLGRSFGMEPANRGIRTAALYRIVRHPIYAAYLWIVAGVLISAPTVWNILLALCWIPIQVERIRREEAFLSRSDAYRHYAARVRWRLLPGVW